MIYELIKDAGRLRDVTTICACVAYNECTQATNTLVAAYLSNQQLHAGCTSRLKHVCISLASEDCLVALRMRR